MPGPGEEGLMGELVSGLDGILGDEKLRLPRLPADPPRPARAQALDSRATQQRNSTAPNNTALL